MTCAQSPPKIAASRRLNICFLLILNLLLKHGGASPSNKPRRLYAHDTTFYPDRVLRVSAFNYPLDCTTRYSVVINGTVPGPELRFQEGQKLWIRVYNDIPDQNITMHWHGLAQRMSPFSDGTPAVTQWPIPPLHYFDYEFQLQLGDAGTYMYHSHVELTAITAVGSLIIEEKHPETTPYQYNDERTILLTDVFHVNDSIMLANLMGDPYRPPGALNNIAVNGISRQNSPNKKGPFCRLSVIAVEPDRVYRIRLIGATFQSWVFLAFEAHDYLMLIEVDGNYVAPVIVDHLEVHSGQRYSVLLRTKSRQELAVLGKKQFFMQIEERGKLAPIRTYALLAYGSLESVDDFTLPPIPPLTIPAEPYQNGWLEDDLHPLPSHPYEDTVPLLHEVTRRVTIGATQDVVIDGTVTWTMNGRTWFETTPEEPYLVSLYRNASQYFPDYENALRNHGFDAKTRTFPAKIGEVLEIVWLNVGNIDVQGGIPGTGQTHPFHAHGDHVWDIGTGSGMYDAEWAERRLLERIKNGGPIKRDTSNLYRAPVENPLPNGTVVGWRVWRIRVRNAGVWMMHCHMLQHMMQGMNTIWVFGELTDLTPLPSNLTAGSLTYGGSAFGNDTYFPLMPGGIFVGNDGQDMFCPPTGAWPFSQGTAVYPPRLRPTSSFTAKLITVIFGDSLSHGFAMHSSSADIAHRYAMLRFPEELGNFTNQTIYVPGNWNCQNLDTIPIMQLLTRDIEDYLKGSYDITILLNSGCAFEVASLADFAREWDVPIIASEASGAILLNSYRFPTLVAFPTQDLNSQVTATKFLLETFLWTRLSLICDDLTRGTIDGFSVATCRTLQAVLGNMPGYQVTINHFDGAPVVSANHTNLYDDMLMQAKLRSRVIILVLGMRSLLRAFMLLAYHLDMTNGDYIFLGLVPPITITAWQSSHRSDLEETNPDILEAYRSLIVINIPSSNLTNVPNLLAEIVARAQSTYNRTCSPNEVSLAANNMVAAYETITSITQALVESYHEFHQGFLITGKYFRAKFINRTFYLPTRSFYIGPRGMRTCDVVLSRLHVESGRMEPAWYYNSTTNVFGAVSSLAFKWRSGPSQPPPNTPVCGFSNDLCIGRFEKTTVAGATVGFLLILIITSLIVYRYHRSVSMKRDDRWWIVELASLQTAAISDSLRPFYIMS